MKKLIFILMVFCLSGCFYCNTAENNEKALQICRKELPEKIIIGARFWDDRLYFGSNTISIECLFRMGTSNLINVSIKEFQSGVK